MIHLAVYDRNHRCLLMQQGETYVHVLLKRKYQKGDTIVLRSSESQFLMVKYEACIDTANIYFEDGSFEYRIPFDDELMPYPAGAFSGEYHILDVRSNLFISNSLIRDISTNPLDVKYITSIYPHCTASVETRDEAIFAARNTIDGLKETKGHGIWPYTSWGDNEDENASITIDFGRKVVMHTIILNLRADFPHDSYWCEMDIVIDGKKSMHIHTVKTGEDQVFELGDKTGKKITLQNLKKNAEEISPFPALTHWQVFGREYL